MRYFLLFSLLFLITFNLIAQTDFYGINFQNDKYLYKDWKFEVLKSANTCENVSYMSEEEKKAVFLINLLRLDPKLFAVTFMFDYLESQNYKVSTDITELAEQLKKTKKMPILQPDKDLYRVAEDFANKNGSSGKIDNKGFLSRYAKIKKQYSSIAENYHYGQNEAIHIVIQMLLDDKNSQKQNRKNLLNKKFNSIGFCIRPHSKYQFNSVSGLATHR